MGEETKRLWLVAGENLEEYGLEDGQVTYYDTEIGNRDHKTLCEKFAKEHGIDVSGCTTHTDFAKCFTSLGIFMLMNAGNISGKRAATLYLPAQMSEKVIEFLENKKELFNEKFHSNSGLFGVAVLPMGDLEYRTNDGFRNLEIESMIEGNPTKDGQELLYREVARQKEALKEQKSI